ncbi:MAG: class I SAM-dependent methyltransferase [Candidatus Diapherotrites archaeon]|nr:class I SAM-dependent methyltransferase [Candidatus Diapherotrites archaeon]
MGTDKSLRTEFIKNEMRGKILDMGCNYGLLHRQIDNKNVTGIDVFVDNYKERVVQGDVNKMPFKDESFDTLVGGELLEHMKDPDKFLKECKRVLKKGGKLIITTPNKKAWLNRLVGSYNISTEKKPPLNALFKFASGPEDHYFVVDKQKLLETIGKHFRIEKYFCLPYDLVSSPHQSKWVYPVRHAVHYLMPEGLQEEQVVVAVKE